MKITCDVVFTYALLLSLADCYIVLAPQRAAATTTALFGKKSRAMGGKQGEMARKMAEAKRQREGSEAVQQDENVNEETKKLQREFDYMLENNAYSINPNEYESEEEMLADMETNPNYSSSSFSSSSLSSQPKKRAVLPPKIYVGDAFPFPSLTSAGEFLFTPRGDSLGRGFPNTKDVPFTTFIIDPRPNSAFFNDAFQSLLLGFKGLPTKSNYLLVSPNSPGQTRQLAKKAGKTLQSGEVEKLVESGVTRTSFGNVFGVFTTDGGTDKDGARSSVKLASENEFYVNLGEKIVCASCAK
ncbi:hypothetical protein TrLO_g11180 [Triparma laevis f. longispina]|uniref:Uncharacterized protein n=1 Tax=Triparma laevis f. longispina TaxID=1714387 RepID=A0A9W7KT12_9STRA|nr:hypothetical protein TrLO_g11180 [Triparma laevis f. longispina]